LKSGQGVTQVTNWHNSIIWTVWRKPHHRFCRNYTTS